MPSPARSIAAKTAIIMFTAVGLSTRGRLLRGGRSVGNEIALREFPPSAHGIAWLSLGWYGQTWGQIAYRPTPVIGAPLLGRKAPRPRQSRSRPSQSRLHLAFGSVSTIPQVLSHLDFST